MVQWYTIGQQRQSEYAQCRPLSTILRIKGSKNSSLRHRAVTSSEVSWAGGVRVKVFVILTFQTILKQIGGRLAGMGFFSYLCSVENEENDDIKENTHRNEHIKDDSDSEDEK